MYVDGTRLTDSGTSWQIFFSGYVFAKIWGIVCVFLLHKFHISSAVCLHLLS